MTSYNVVKQLTLYYDGQCPVCAKEIALLKRLTPAGTGFTDIHNIEDYSQLPDKTALLKRLHLQSDCGQWFVGLNATVKIWGQTRFGFLVRILNWPGVRTLAEFAYSRWANRRYCNRYLLCDRATD